MTKSSENITRIIVVDDSAFMRKAISMMLESDPTIKVIATAKDGQEAVDLVKEHNPDLVTMDIEMPKMDGLAALRQIMTTNPVPVMMISSLTTDGANATLDALELGAVDFIPKQLSHVSLDIVKIKEELLLKIKEIARRKSLLMAKYRTRMINETSDNIRKISSKTARKNRPMKRRDHRIGLIAIGSSTGGPPALQEIISKFPRNLPVGVIVAQHMPSQFTKSLAERLNKYSQVEVVEAVGGEKIKPGHVYLCPGGQHIMVRKSGTNYYIKVSSFPKQSIYKPSVDVLMQSVASTFGKAGMGVILTGMGSDGLNGFKDMKREGSIIIAQNEESSVVYGMPRAVVDAKLANHVTHVDTICNEIMSYF